jgi:uncharacterized protein (DUF1810 family)
MEKFLAWVVLEERCKEIINSLTQELRSIRLEEIFGSTLKLKIP